MIGVFSPEAAAPAVITTTVIIAAIAAGKHYLTALDSHSKAVTSWQYRLCKNLLIMDVTIHLVVPQPTLLWMMALAHEDPLHLASLTNSPESPSEHLKSAEIQ